MLKGEQLAFAKGKHKLCFRQGTAGQSTLQLGMANEGEEKSSALSIAHCWPVPCETIAIWRITAITEEFKLLGRISAFESGVENPSQLRLCWTSSTNHFYFLKVFKDGSHFNVLFQKNMLKKKIIIKTWSAHMLLAWTFPLLWVQQPNSLYSDVLLCMEDQSWEGRVECI